MKFSVFYRNPDTLSGSPDTSFVGRIFERTQNLSEKIPADIRKSLSDLAAEINGSAEEVKKGGNPATEVKLRELKEKSRNWYQKSLREGKTAELKNQKEFEKLLSGVSGFDTIKAGDVLRLRQKGADIARFLLTDMDGEEVDLSKERIQTQVGKKLLINFGENTSINATIGLGDILPYTVDKVRITDKNGKTVEGTLGSADSRKGRNPRVGYYDTSGKYIPVYSGYSVEILSIKDPDPQVVESYTTLASEQVKRVRIREMYERQRILGDDYKKEFQDQADMELYSQVELYAENQKRRQERSREAYGSFLGKERFLQLFGPYVNEVCKEYDLPPALLIKLFEGETTDFHIFARNPDTNAYGLGQIIPDTWSAIETKILRRDLDENDPKDQILASVALLADIKEKRNVSWTRAAILYHTGEGLLGLSKAKIDEYLRKNAEKIRQNFRGHPGMSDREYAEAYAEAAEAYYGFSEIKETGYSPLTIPESRFALSGFVSHPIEYTESGITACSRTAWKNLGEFGIESPRGPSAKASEELQTEQKYSLSELYKSTNINVVDMYVDSGTDNGRIYGHRCVAIRGADNIWYVLDPYNNAKGPTPIDIYLKSYQGGSIDPNPRFYGYKATNYLAKAILA